MIHALAQLILTVDKVSTRQTCSRGRETPEGRFGGDIAQPFALLKYSQHRRSLQQSAVQSRGL